MRAHAKPWEQRHALWTCGLHLNTTTPMEGKTRQRGSRSVRWVRTGETIEWLQVVFELTRLWWRSRTWRWARFTRFRWRLQTLGRRQGTSWWGSPSWRWCTLTITWSIRNCDGSYSDVHSSVFQQKGVTLSQDESLHLLINMSLCSVGWFESNVILFSVLVFLSVI